MFPGLTELLLIGYSIESIWTPKSKSNTLTPKTNSRTCWPREIFTRDEWNHLLCLFNISHFSSSNCSEVMSKRTQKIRWRKSYCKIEADDEFSLAMQRKDSWRFCLYCITKPAENQTWKSTTSELMEWAASKNTGDLFWTLTHQVTQSGMLKRIGLLKSGNLMNWWKLEQGDLFMNNHPVCSQSTRTNLLLMTMIWTLTRRRIRHVVIIQIILAQGQWSSVIDSRQILKRCNTSQ